MEKCCATCFYGEPLDFNDAQCYCSGGGPRFADYVNKDSCCERWAKDQHDDEGYREWLRMQKERMAVYMPKGAGT